VKDREEGGWGLRGGEEGGGGFTREMYLRGRGSRLWRVC